MNGGWHRWRSQYLERYKMVVTDKRAKFRKRRRLRKMGNVQICLNTRRDGHGGVALLLLHCGGVRRAYQKRPSAMYTSPVPQHPIRNIECLNLTLLFCTLEWLSYWCLNCICLGTLNTPISALQMSSGIFAIKRPDHGPTKRPSYVQDIPKS